MGIQATLSSAPTLFAMSCRDGRPDATADKKPRVSEAYSFYEFPLQKLALEKPEPLTKSVFFIPELQDSTRVPLVILTPPQGSGYVYVLT